MAENSAAPAPGAPSDVLMAIYTGDRDRALALAAGVTLTLPELAALGDVAPLAARLREAAVDVQERSPDGWTALHLAGFVGAAGALALLVRAGADLRARAHNAQGNTPLHAAIAGRCDAACVAALVAAGCDVAVPDAHGYTPLHLAASRGNDGITELLVACGAARDLLATDGRTPASIARERGHSGLADRLERHDAWS
ncbi:MAG: ankyrin repeat domain-containing protein [Gemmatimonadaceae bacterium]|nr:ankyrin repeat domain-containing protein [Gemmatimonadaceae bacterium]